jgi:hypothetical protein
MEKNKWGWNCKKKKNLKITSNISNINQENRDQIWKIKKS